MPLHEAHIGFPEGLLNENHYRLPILIGEGLFFLEKLPGMAGIGHPVCGRFPDLKKGIEQQIGQSKPELARLGIGELHFIAGPEPDVFGPCLYATSEEVASELRELLGARKISFEYYFISRQQEKMESRVCSLPIARHFSEPRMLVSHQTGKKCETRFEQLYTGNGFGLYKATSTYHRLHQVRVHAVESGLPIAGDRKYANHGPLNSAELNQDRKSKGRTVWPWPAFWLQRISFEWRGEWIEYSVGRLPKALRGSLRKIGCGKLVE